MSDMRCGDIMKRAPVYIGPEAKAEEAARTMQDASIGFLPVCDLEGRVLGVITDRDIALRVCGAGLSARETTVRDVMTHGIVSCHPSDPVSLAETLMAKELKTRIVMTDDDGRLLGLISLVDLAHYEEPLRVARLVRQIGIREFRFGR
jgi:CBS domain-containing protein